MARSISDILVQRNFRSAKQKAMLGLLLVSNQIAGKQSDFFKQYGITMQQFNVLRILRGQQPNPCTIQLIQERMMDKMSDVSRLVERLRLAGYVFRCLKEDNRRAVDVTITESGLQLLATIDERIDALDDLGDLNDAEAEELTRLLEKILE